MPRLALLAVALLAAPACKHREVPAAPFVPPPGTPAPVEPTVDALNPPPPPVHDLATRADTVNGDPNGPKQADLDAAQGAMQSAVQRCLDALPPAAISTPVRLNVKYTIRNEGKASDIEVTGGATPEITACGKTAAEQTDFPRFGGPTLTHAFTLSYSRVQPPDLSSGAR